MSCTRFAGDRILQAYDEPVGADGEKHLDSCDRCRAEIDEILEVRRLYREVRPRRLHARVKQGIDSSLRRERNRGRVRSALASLAGVAAAFFLLAGIGGAPTVVAAAVPIPAGSTIDQGLEEIQVRLDDLESENRTYFDSTLDELRDRVSLLSWDAENM